MNNDTLIRKAREKANRGKYPYFMSENTNARYTIGRSNGVYVLTIFTTGGVLTPTVVHNGYKTRAAAERALRDVADMFVANGVPVTWYRSEGT